MSVKWKYFLAVLSLIAIVVWLAVLRYPPEKLYIIACDVGQGDAVLVIYGETQILIDGGPDERVVDCLSRYFPFWDRQIELIILSHPQEDHYAGLIEILKRYDVLTFIGSSLDSGNQKYGLLKSMVGGSGARVINPTSGMVIRLGMIYLDILHPSKRFLSENSLWRGSTEKNNVLGASTSKRDPNEFSIVTLLRLGKFDALFTGDIGPSISNSIAEKINNNKKGSVEYIKIPHHGSKNGVSGKLLDAVKPEYAIISVGAKNRYGHPHSEVIELLKDRDIKILRTDESGDVVVESDGSSMWLVN
jgi:competence protein ComEC